VAVIGYLGPEGTFTHVAARDLAPAGDELRPLRTAVEVVHAVEAGVVDGGVVAFENSLEGPVAANLDVLLFDTRSCLLAGERALGVAFSLWRRADDEAPLQGVLSHPFGLAQCARWIERAGVATREATSTVAACEAVAGDGRPGWGALAPPLAGAPYGLAAVDEGVQDDPRAATRFVLLRRACPPPTGRDRSAFAFRPRQDEPGSLVRLLSEFSVRGINLTTIKSRPTKELLGEYVFFIECEGHIADGEVRDAVLGLLRFPGETRFLGSFPEDPSRPSHASRLRDPAAQAAYEAMLARIDG
jgi:prephenate dehydratase